MTSDMKFIRTKRALAEIAEYGVPDGIDLWPSVSAAVHGRRYPAANRFRRAWMMPAVAAVAVLGVAATAAVVAAPKMVDDLNSILTNEHGDDAELGAPVELGLTQTKNGVTVTLHTARTTRLKGADGVVEEGLIALEWTVFESPNGVENGAGFLMDSQGHRLTQAGGIATDRTTELFSDEIPPGARKWAYLYDLKGAQVEGDELRLVMEFPLFRRIATDPASEQTPPPTPEWLTREDGSTYGAIIQPTPLTPVEKAGTITVEFTVPVEGGLSEPGEEPMMSPLQPDNSQLLEPTFPPVK